jgi:enhancing lycopene biosynthesis protein 2
MAKIGVVLSGCGFKDGAEIQEAVLTLYFLDRAGAEVVCMAPDINQHHTVNHLTGETVNETRNVLVESARIARGNIKNIKEVNVRDLDAVIFPGGFGAALNLSDFGLNGSNSSVNKDVENLIKEVHTLRKTLGFICISPAVCARVLGNSVKVTIGNDEGTANEINKTGAIHQNKEVDEICVDLESKVVSTPAYMFDSTPSKVGEGIEKLVNKVIELSN